MPTASDYGSSQNGINGHGGEHERPSAGTPSLSTIVRKGMWPTPLTSDDHAKFQMSGDQRDDPRPNLPMAVQLWPTPCASDVKGKTSNDRAGKRGARLNNAVALWPTPTRTDANDSARHATTTGVMHPGTMMLDAVREHVADTPLAEDFPVVVNARFVEALMNLPRDWTDIAPTPEDLAWVRAEEAAKRKANPLICDDDET